MKESGEETHKEPNPLPKGEQYCDDAETSHETEAINATDQFEDVIDFEHLYASMQKCKVGVLWKDSVASFYMHGIERVIRLERDLKNGTYKAKPPKSFMIYLPKKRNIVSICFRDRVYQRALNDYAIYPAMTKSFIYDNWACQKGKGTDAARDRLKEFMHRFYRKHGAEGYFLKIDIKGYYPNMSHKAVEGLFKEKLRPDVYKRTVRILREQYSGDKGYNPGSQLIQIAGISLLDRTDHFIKEQLRIKYYLRYMDDFVLIHQDRDFLAESLSQIESELAKVGCTINRQKTTITTLKSGISFLGFRYRLTDTGKVLMLISSDNIRLERRRLRHMARKVRRGDSTKEKADEMYSAWKAHASKGNTHKVMQRMERFYNNLWR